MDPTGGKKQRSSSLIDEIDFKQNSMQPDLSALALAGLTDPQKLVDEI